MKKIDLEGDRIEMSDLDLDFPIDEVELGPSLGKALAGRDFRVGYDINYLKKFFPQGTGVYLAVVNLNTLTVQAQQIDDRAQKLLTKGLQADTKKQAAKKAKRAAAERKRLQAKKRKAAERKRLEKAVASLARLLR